MSNARYGGGYLVPASFLDAEPASVPLYPYADRDSWLSLQGKFGVVVLSIPHTSTLDFREDLKSAPIKITNNEPVVISRDGLIATSFPTSADSNNKAIAAISYHLNTFLASILLGGITVVSFSEKQIDHVRLNENRLEQISAGGDNFSQTNLQRSLLRKTAPPRDFPRVPMRILGTDSVESAYKKGDAIVSALPKKGASVLLLLCCGYFAEQNWAAALITGWTFVETIISAMWNNLVKRVATGDRERRTRLQDFRTYTAAVQIEVLVQSGAVGIDLAGKLHVLRKARNNLAHNGVLPTKAHGSLVFSCVQALLRKHVTSIRTELSWPGRVISGGWVETPFGE